MKRALVLTFVLAFGFVHLCRAQAPGSRGGAIQAPEILELQVQLQEVKTQLKRLTDQNQSLLAHLQQVEERLARQQTPLAEVDRVGRGDHPAAASALSTMLPAQQEGPAAPT